MGAQLFGVPDEEYPFSHLRYAVVGRVEERVPTGVPYLLQNLAHLLGDVVSTIVQRVGHFFHENGYGLELPYVFQVPQI